MTQSESAPGRRPSLVLPQWPSSSTLYKSDSLRMSEISIDLGGSQQRMDTPLPQARQHSPLTYEHPDHQLFLSGNLLSVRPGISSISNLTESKLSLNRRRALIGKFKSFPKLMPIKRNSSIGSSGSNSRAKKGVRWKPMTDLPPAISLDNPTSQKEKPYSITSGGEYKHSMHNRYNSLGTPDVKFADLEFPVLKTKLDEPLYCDLCQKRIQQILALTHSETVGYDINLKHSVSAPLITDEYIENSCGLNRSYSWQNKFLDKIRFRTRRRTSSPCSELQCKPGITDSTSLYSQSVPNIAFWADSSMPTDIQEVKEFGSEFDPLARTTKESMRENVSPLLGSAPAELPSVKTVLVPYFELEMDASSPPTSRKDSDTLNERSSLDASSWKSADWTTLLGGDIRSS